MMIAQLSNVNMTEPLRRTVLHETPNVFFVSAKEAFLAKRALATAWEQEEIAVQRSREQGTGTRM